MSEAPRRRALVALVVLVLAAGCVGGFDVFTDQGPGGTTTAPGTSEAPTDSGTADVTGTESTTPAGPTVTVVDENGSALGTVSVTVADTDQERYTGLSDTESLGPNEGMLFVHEEEGNYDYVMRDMAFPIDIVFVGADRRITEIHHAEPESWPYTRYGGRGKYVLEVPYEWTTDHGVEVGDRVRIDDATEE